jgi:hypothetical protein
MTSRACMLGTCSVISLLALAGCGAAGSFRVVEKTSGGGVVALPSAQDMGREKAEQYMKSQCPTGYDVQKEAEAVIGSDTTQGTQKASFFSAPTAASTTTQKTEWRIEFKCKGGAPDAPPADQNAKKSTSQVHTFIVRY